MARGLALLDQIKRTSAVAAASRADSATAQAALSERRRAIEVRLLNTTLGKG
jgi:hypothetical protein